MRRGPCQLSHWRDSYGRPFCGPVRAGDQPLHGGRALRAGKDIVDRVDALTRLNRQRGVGMAMITHTMSDLLALPTEADRMKARGFVERSGMVICGGLPTAEMPQLNAALPFFRAEQDLLTGWIAPPAFDTVAGNRQGDRATRAKTCWSRSVAAQASRCT